MKKRVLLALCVCAVAMGAALWVARIRSGRLGKAPPLQRSGSAREIF